MQSPTATTTRLPVLRASCTKFMKICPTAHLQTFGLPALGGVGADANRLFGQVNLPKTRETTPLLQDVDLYIQIPKHQVVRFAQAPTLQSRRVYSIHTAPALTAARLGGAGFAPPNHPILVRGFGVRGSAPPCEGVVESPSQNHPQTFANLLGSFLALPHNKKTSRSSLGRGKGKEHLWFLPLRSIVVKRG